MASSSPPAPSTWWANSARSSSARRTTPHESSTGSRNFAGKRAERSPGCIDRTQAPLVLLSVAHLPSAAPPDRPCDGLLRLHLAHLRPVGQVRQSATLHRPSLGPNPPRHLAVAHPVCGRRKAPPPRDRRLRRQPPQLLRHPGPVRLSPLPVPHPRQAVPLEDPLHWLVPAPLRPGPR